MADNNPVLDAYFDTQLQDSYKQMSKILATYYAHLLLAGFQRDEAMTLLVAYQNLIVLRSVNS